MNYSWTFVATYIEREMGGYVDWEEEFFNCPECGEPIYKSDWYGHRAWEICPVCGIEIID